MRAPGHHVVGALAATAVAAACAEPAPPRARAAQPIIGGIADRARDYVVGVGDERGAWCSASLVSRRTVLTAAHCAGGITRVYFGPELDGPPAPIAIDREVVHPAYRGPEWGDDLAMVRLVADAPVQPVPLLRETMTAADFVGPLFSWVGYGVDDGFAQSGAGTRRVVRYPIVGIGPLTIDDVDIDDSVFLYDQPVLHACFGDSGGPSFVVRDGVERQAGVASWVETEVCTGYGGHTRSDRSGLDDFIQPTIDDFEGDDPCRADGACAAGCDGPGALVDPDCAPAHCGADGLCARACALPVDPDCRSPDIDLCGEDGLCDPTCVAADPDCAGAVFPDAGPPPDAPWPDAVPVPDAAPGPGAGDGDAGCGCAASRRRGGPSPSWTLAALLGLALSAARAARPRTATSRWAGSPRRRRARHSRARAE